MLYMNHICRPWLPLKPFLPQHPQDGIHLVIEDDGATPDTLIASSEITKSGNDEPRRVAQEICW
jgi:hypothetical protein